MELKKEQKEILHTLRHQGSLTPIELSVKNLILPDEVMESVEEMEKEGYIKKIRLETAEQYIVSLTQRGIYKADKEK